MEFIPTFFLAFLLSVTTLAQDTLFASLGFVCPQGYTKRPGSISCYKFYWKEAGQGVDWQTATQQCVVDHKFGKLLVIDDIGEYEFIKFLWPVCKGTDCDKQYFWIGATNVGDWEWIDETPIPYNAPWDYGFPTKEGKCAALEFKNYRVLIVNAACYVPFYFICEIDLTPDPCQNSPTFSKRSLASSSAENSLATAGNTKSIQKRASFQDQFNANDPNLRFDDRDENFRRNFRVNDNRMPVLMNQDSRQSPSRMNTNSIVIGSNSARSNDIDRVQVLPGTINAKPLVVEQVSRGGSPSPRDSSILNRFSSPVYFPHPFYNRKFIYCSLEKGRLVKNCPYDWYWNVDIKRCSKQAFGSDENPMTSGMSGGMGGMGTGIGKMGDGMGGIGGGMGGIGGGMGGIGGGMGGIGGGMGGIGGGMGGIGGGMGGIGGGMGGIGGGMGGIGGGMGGIGGGMGGIGGGMGGIGGGMGGFGGGMGGIGGGMGGIGGRQGRKKRAP
ncbi:unnamed protein product [Gordionus sp. m RMFG-2023]|uniref:uncharacterized protein LOC135924506 n=1 Tax=Gordionus sp. m RMFG-2023 TaxID=3053472 RepID=UPI0030E2F56A